MSENTQKVDTATFTPTAEDLQYTPEMADRERAMKLIKAATMRGVVVGAESGVIPTSKNLYVRLRCAPVNKDNKKVGNALAEYTLVLPMANPRVQGHEEPDTMSLCWRALCAIDPDFPRFARKRKDGQGFETHDGEPIDKATYSAIRKKVKTAIGQRMVELWKDPKQLLDETFFMTVEHYTAKNGVTYARIKDINTKLRDGVVAIEDDFLV